MKQREPFVLPFLMFCFIIWQNVYSQLLNLDYKKGEYLPPYNPDVVIISPDVEKWMKEQLTNKDNEKRIVEMKTDVMGRVKSSADKTGRGDVRVVENKQKRLVVVSDMHIPQIEIEPICGRYEYNSETKKYDYSLNGKKINEKEYFDFIEKRNEKYNSQNRGKRNLPIPGVVSSGSRSWTAWMTAEEISELVKKYKELAIDDYMEPIAESSAASILSNIQISTHAFPNGYEGYGIGVYVMEPSCRDVNIPIYRPNRYTNNCTGPTTADASHHSRVVNVVQHAAPLAQIFGFSTSPPYPNPDSYFPPIEIGTHSYGWTTGSQYHNEDMNMDNHIYTDRIINFKSAGNTGGNITSPGKAVNIITVGAVCPAAPCTSDQNNITNGYTSYSSRWNSETGNEKPEIGMYTDIDMGIYGFIYGTSAASPLAAGFTATLLDQHPFFKRHPALVKAVLLTGETIPIVNASSWDTDNSYGAARAITTYSSVAWGTGSLYCEGGNSSCFDSNNELVVDENVQTGQRYRIAIAWLVPGDYMFNSSINPGKALPQDIDLIVYQNNRVIASSKSTRNPYEVVDFVTTSNAPLKVVIHRYSNSGHGDVLLGYHRRGGF